MTPKSNSTPAARASGSSETTWQVIWKAVPDEWAEGVYCLDRPPHNEVFVRNTM